MNVLEDKIRAAFEQTAADIAPQAVPPLRLPTGRLTGRLGPAGRHRWRAWLTPPAAAAAVAAVVVATLTISGAIHGPRPRTGPTGGRQGPLAGVPPYYVVLAGKNPSPSVMQPQSATVRASATGTVLATVTPPRPYRTFEMARTAGDNHTFLLIAGRWETTHKQGGTFVRTGPPRLFLLHIGLDGRTTRLTPLLAPQEPANAQISDVALSPDGSRLAVALRGGTGGGPGPQIQVFTLATGAERVWTWPGGGPITNNAGGNGEVLSWASDGRTLAFQQWVTGNIIDLRLLDTATSGHNLQTASRLVLRWPGDGATWHFVHGKISNVIFGFSAVITPDGTRIVAATVSETKHPLSSELAFTEFSATTGKVVAVLDRWRLPGLYPGQVQDVLWSSASGSKLIVLAHKPGVPTRDPHSVNSAGYGIEFGVLTPNGFAPLPGAPRPGAGPWPVW
jgi:hypothetical protein